MAAKALLILCLVVIALAIPVSAAAAPAQSSGGVWHLVKRGETLNSIGRVYGVPVDAIAAVNGLVHVNQIWAGTWLWIPAENRPPTEPPGPTCRTKYTVRRDDTLAAIGRAYGVGVWRLAQANHIRNVNLIYPGQRLCIPWPGVPR
jgi:LysM repeat protein